MHRASGASLGVPVCVCGLPDSLERAVNTPSARIVVYVILQN